MKGLTVAKYYFTHYDNVKMILLSKYIYGIGVSLYCNLYFHLRNNHKIILVEWLKRPKTWLVQLNVFLKQNHNLKHPSPLHGIERCTLPLRSPSTQPLSLTFSLLLFVAVKKKNKLCYFSWSPTGHFVSVWFA